MNGDSDIGKKSGAAGATDSATAARAVSSGRRLSVRITTCNHVVHDECLVRDAVQLQLQLQGAQGVPKEPPGKEKERNDKVTETGVDKNAIPGSGSGSGSGRPDDTAASSHCSISGSSSAMSSLHQSVNCAMGDLQCPICRMGLEGSGEA